MWDVWWCLFSIIEAMICMGSGSSSVGWTGTLHLVTHNQSYRNKALVQSQQRDPPLKGTVEQVVFVAHSSWLEPRIIRLETPMVAELISWSPGLWLTFFEAPTASPVYEQNIANIIKYKDPHWLLIDRQWLYCWCPWWPAAPRFVEAGTEEKEPEWMNEWINQSNNPSSTIPPQFDSTKRSLRHLIYDKVYLCAGGCSWCGCSLKIIPKPPIFINFYWKLETPIFSNGLPTHFSPLCLGYLSSLRWSLERVRWFHQ